MTNDDLNELDLWRTFPAEHRLRACLEAHLSGDGHAEQVKALSQTLGYSHPTSVELWLSLSSHVPIRHLPRIAAFIGVDLAVLVTLWLSEQGQTDEIAEHLFNAVKPRITDAEFEIVEMMRAVFSDDDDQVDVLPPK